jgi:hypothetical protein
MTKAMTLSYEERMKLARYLGEMSIEVEKLNTEIKRLERILDTEPRRLYQIQKIHWGKRFHARRYEKD